MCGIAAIVGWKGDGRELEARLGGINHVQRHRGPDAEGIWVDSATGAGLGHVRLSIVDLSEAGRQPMTSADARLMISYNGEVYNFPELRRELAGYPFRTGTVTEVLLAAWDRWGLGCLDRLVGMFAFVVWDVRERRLTAVRDRFGVKPLHYGWLQDGAMTVASEVSGIHAAGVERRACQKAWARVLAHGISDWDELTFYEGVSSLPAGCALEWEGGRVQVRRWYDLASLALAGGEPRSETEAAEEYCALMEMSVRLRFRADVAVGVNLSGGLDSASLLGAVHAVQGRDSRVTAFTFTTGDDRYDEAAWARRMLERTAHHHEVVQLSPAEAPVLHEEQMRVQGGPYGGLPTLAYAKLFRAAREMGVKALMDGQGMDEQWCGYDYYRMGAGAVNAPLYQGGRNGALAPECLTPEFAAMAEGEVPVGPLGDRIRDLQWRDLCLTKIPRALRYNDRASMASSVELREPFLDHRLVEYALAQPAERKIGDGEGKRLLRWIVRKWVPEDLALAPKRAVQTPQREWLRGPLREWAEAMMERAGRRGWFEDQAMRNRWAAFLRGELDHSNCIWQWICAAGAE